ncbi:MAG: glycosyltransferase family 39 protein [Myxococcales bacterium]|nr:glycosyltransferase family 39 protein [Myxococcales bacterium]
MLAGLQSNEAHAAGIDSLMGGVHGAYRVSSVRVRSPGQAAVWLSTQAHRSTQIILICRAADDPKLPAAAHTRLFDLRIGRRGATPEPLAEAVNSLAKAVQGLGLSCEELMPPAGSHHRPAPQLHTHGSAKDTRFTVSVERAVGMPLRDISGWWLLFVLMLVAIWVRRGDAASGSSLPVSATEIPSRQWLILAGIIGFSLTLRLIMVGIFTLNPDEHASLDAASWLDVFRGDDDSLYHPPLARAIFRGWTSIWPGQHAAPRWWWRLPSLVTGTATIALIWRVGWQFGGAAVAITAAVLFGALPHGVFISNLAKPYAMTTCAVVACLAAYRDLHHANLAHPPRQQQQSRQTRRRVAWVALLAATVAWLDYPAALALALAALVGLRHRSTWPTLLPAGLIASLAALPLLPLALAGAQYSAMRTNGGPPLPGFPNNAPHAPPTDAMAGRGFGELLELSVFRLEFDAFGPAEQSLLAVICLMLALIGAWRTARSVVLTWLLWLGLAAGLAATVYLRPQNLGFLLTLTQLLLAIGLVQLLRRRPQALAVAIVLILAARVPQWRTLYANQVHDSIADMAFGLDCHRLADALRTQGADKPGTGDVLVQIGGDPHCLLVELVDGDPHQRAFPLQGHRPGGAPCYDAAGMRLCAAGDSSGDVSRELQQFDRGFVAIRRDKRPTAPARCQTVASTGDFDLWHCTASSAATP